jgi:hypothetical protein
MLCAVGGAGPDQEEAAAWIDLVVGLARSGGVRHAGGVRRVHLYGKARPAPADPAAAALPLAALEKRAAALRAAFLDAGLDPAPRSKSSSDGGPAIPCGLGLRCYGYRQRARPRSLR